MPLQFVCTGCGKRYDLDDSVRGRRVRCKSCGRVSRVTEPSTPSSASIGGLTAGDLYGLSEGPASSPEPLKKASTLPRKDQIEHSLPSIKKPRSTIRARSLLLDALLSGKRGRRTL